MNMNLLRAADPDSLAPLEHQLRSLTLKPTDSIGSTYSEASRQQTVDQVIDLRSSVIKSTTAPGTRYFTRSASRQAPSLCS